MKSILSQTLKVDHSRVDRPLQFLPSSPSPTWNFQVSIALLAPGLSVVERKNRLFNNQNSGIVCAHSKSGVLAQLVERLNGIEEVRGSNPLGSNDCISEIQILEVFGVRASSLRSVKLNNASSENGQSFQQIR